MPGGRASPRGGGVGASWMGYDTEKRQRDSEGTGRGARSPGFSSQLCHFRPVGPQFPD